MILNSSIFIIVVLLAISIKNIDAKSKSKSYRRIRDSLDRLTGKDWMSSQIFKFQTDHKYARSVDLTEWDGAKCSRTCQTNERPRICYFTFDVEMYHAMGP